MNGARFITESLKAHGVTTILVIPAVQLCRFMMQFMIQGWIICSVEMSKVRQWLRSVMLVPAVKWVFVSPLPARVRLI